MSDEAPVPPPKFKYAFPTPGEMIPEAAFGRFERYVARQKGETDPLYATRLERLGLAVKITTDDARDIAAFRGLTREAIDRGLPVVMLTSPIADDSSADDPATVEAAKAAALEAARTAKF